MTSVSPLISELGDRVELSDDRRKERRQAARATRHAVNENVDQLQAFCDDLSLWKEADRCGHCTGPLARIQLRLRALVSAQHSAIAAVNAVAEQNEIAEDELVSNTKIVVLRAVEGFLANRPAEVAVATPSGVPRRVDVFAAPKTRVDMFNPALGEVQPPGAEGGAFGKDPTDSLQISDM